MQLLRSPEGRNILLAGGLTLVWALLIVAIVNQVVGVFTNTMVFTLTGLGIAILGLLFFRSLTRRYRKRLSARKKSFPPAWQTPFSMATTDELEDEEQEVLRKQVLVFLAEKTQTGVGHKPTEHLRVLLATAMRWPVRHHSGWDYPELLEILWYNFSFQEKPELYQQLVPKLEEILDEKPLVSVLPVSAVDIERLLSGPTFRRSWINSTLGDDTSLRESVMKFPLQIIALSYIQNVVEYGIHKGLLPHGNRLTMAELFHLSEEGFYKDKKQLILTNRKAAETMNFVFQDGRLGWRRAIADLMWQRPGILGPNAPKVDELA